MEIMLCHLTWGMKHLCNSKGFFLHVGTGIMFLFFGSQIHQDLECYIHISDWFLNPWSLCLLFFLSSFYFSPDDSPLSTIKIFFFFFYLKCSFHSWHIQFFVFSSSSLFFPVSHNFKGWSEKKVKVYDVINWLNKSLIIHFVWYLENGLKCDI